MNTTLLNINVLARFEISSVPLPFKMKEQPGLLRSSRLRPRIRLTHLPTGKLHQISYTFCLGLDSSIKALAIAQVEGRWWKHTFIAAGLLAFQSLKFSGFLFGRYLQWSSDWF